MDNFRCYTLGILFMSLSFCSSTMAYFRVGTDPSASPYKGTSESIDFGEEETGSSKPITHDSRLDPKDGIQYPHAKGLPSKISPFCRYYARFRFSFNKLKLEKIKNKQFEGDQSLGEVSQKTVSRDVVGFDLAYGYVWHHWRYDLEWVWNRRLRYDPIPVISEPAVSLKLRSHVNSYALLNNLYYDFKEVFIFKPYIFGTLGFTINHTKVDELSIGTGTGDPPAGTILGSRANVTVWPAWGFGFGVRYHLLNRCVLDLFYRYLSLGSFKWTPAKRVSRFPVKLKGDFSFQGFGIGLHYLF